MDGFDVVAKWFETYNADTEGPYEFTLEVRLCEFRPGVRQGWIRSRSGGRIIGGIEIQPVMGAPQLMYGDPDSGIIDGTASLADASNDYLTAWSSFKPWLIDSARRELASSGLVTPEIVANALASAAAKLGWEVCEDEPHTSDFYGDAWNGE